MKFMYNITDYNTAGSCMDWYVVNVPQGCRECQSCQSRSNSTHTKTHMHSYRRREKLCIDWDDYYKRCGLDLGLIQEYPCTSSESKQYDLSACESWTICNLYLQYHKLCNRLLYCYYKIMSTFSCHKRWQDFIRRGGLYQRKRRGVNLCHY